MIVRRFLSLFGPSARRETCQVAISVGNHEFGIRGSRTIFAGWISYYRRYWSPRDVEFPSLEEGDKARVHEIRIEEKAEEPPPRFSQGSLLEKMEKERIGTKATRAETISTLVARGYAEGEDLRVTELGLAVMEILERYVPSITTTDLTRQIEERLEAIEAGQTDEKELVRETVRAVSEQLMSLGEVEDSIGNDINGAVMKAAASAYALGNCPVCKIGMLRIVKSRKTGKRFVGCSNYPGCRTSAPLPQRGKLKASTRPCQHCSWPVVYIQSRGHPWKLCVNPGCPSKGLK